MKRPASPTVVDVSRETAERLRLFIDLLTKWNSRINLVSPTDLGQLRTRHIDDSLQLLRFLPPDGDLLDLGSGAGFPGLILGLVSGRGVTLIESDHRKATFLHEAARVTGTAATIRCERIEDTTLRSVPIITARALAPLDRLFALCAPLLHPDGICLFLKGANVAAELTVAEQRWQMSAHRHPTSSGKSGCILEVQNLRPVDPART